MKIQDQNEIIHYHTLNMTRVVSYCTIKYFFTKVLVRFVHFATRCPQCTEIGMNCFRSLFTIESETCFFQFAKLSKMHKYNMDSCCHSDSDLHVSYLKSFDGSFEVRIQLFSKRLIHHTVELLKS